MAPHRKRLVLLCVSPSTMICARAPFHTHLHVKRVPLTGVGRCHSPKFSILLCFCLIARLHRLPRRIGSPLAEAVGQSAAGPAGSRSQRPPIRPFFLCGQCLPTPNIPRPRHRDCSFPVLPPKMSLPMLTFVILLQSRV